MKIRALLIIPINAVSILYSLIPWMEEFDIMKTIPCNLYASDEVCYILKNIDAIIIDNEKYITEQTVTKIATYFLNKNKKVYLYKKISYINEKLNEEIVCLSNNSLYKNKNNVSGNVTIPVIYIYQE